jgi:hypothetical protein
MGERKDGRLAVEEANGYAAGCWRGRGTETETHRYMGDVDRWDGEDVDHPYKRSELDREFRVSVGNETDTPIQGSIQSRPLASHPITSPYSMPHASHPFPALLVFLTIADRHHHRQA